MIGKILRHLREGTWADALRFHVDRWLSPKIKRRQSTHVRAAGIHRFDIRNRNEAIWFLVQQAIDWKAKRPGQTIIVCAADARDVSEFRTALSAAGINASVCPEANGLPPSESISCFICSDFTAAVQYSLAYRLNGMKGYDEIPFEYISRPSEEFHTARELTSYGSFDFVSPLLIDKTPYFELYRESLTRFEMKCEVRDFMDLAQVITHIVRRKVEGTVCEFGSFKGHSGYLISRLLEAEHSDKQVCLFDMFEHFPEESAGVDAFWSKTHEVDFLAVRDSLRECKNVRLIKGDFTSTFPHAGIDKIAFAHVDCDSYRATKFLTEEIFEKRLSRNGILLFEDYGHPSLLGNRLAVHEYFDGRNDCLTFFSQFSGCYLVVKV